MLKEEFQSLKRYFTLNINELKATLKSSANDSILSPVIEQSGILQLTSDLEDLIEARKKLIFIYKMAKATSLHEQARKLTQEVNDKSLSEKFASKTPIYSIFDKNIPKVKKRQRKPKDPFNSKK